MKKFREGLSRSFSHITNEINEIFKGEAKEIMRIIVYFSMLLSWHFYVAQLTFISWKIFDKKIIPKLDCIIYNDVK